MRMSVELRRERSSVIKSCCSSLLRSARRAFTRRPECAVNAGRRLFTTHKGQENTSKHGLARYFQRHGLKEVTVARGVSCKPVEVEQSQMFVGLWVAISGSVHLTEPEGGWLIASDSPFKRCCSPRDRNQPMTLHLACLHA
jgi:hypothetical protein